MSTAASAALRAAVHDALKNNAALNALLGGSRVYDEPPRGAAFPYVTLGEARISNFSSGDVSAEEHQLTLHAWSRRGGHNEAHQIAGALLQALDDAPLAPPMATISSTCASPSPTSAARPTAAPITRWCASAP